MGQRRWTGLRPLEPDALPSGLLLSPELPLGTLGTSSLEGKLYNLGGRKLPPRGAPEEAAMVGVS